ncbi:2-keto-4-pentenoate hydratase [Inquilinus sp. Marseille-Q2685]|uniref:2-keto-4-pentenoate hydratase n=1 Tax=Inquilinus sp. Marseille-Q2685 TaxID=2866581 RepID=UPI001CE493F4|nr:fumarylacetoacetate hydrolase family protein [Inquilinus sp. Marseille-Q2685]
MAIDRHSAAGVLAGHRLRPGAFPGLPEALRPPDLAAARRLQDAVHERLSARLGPRAGWKIGCTTPVMPRFLGIPEPCEGGIFQANVQESPGRFPAAAHPRVGVECEIAVRIGRDLPPGEHGRDALEAAVESVLPAIEVVDDRYADFAALGAPTLLADDFFQAGCVLGPPVADWRSLDLAALSGRMWVDGAEAGHGHGRDVLGHPLNALAWLAGTLARRGRGLVAGEIVLLGSLVQTQWPGPGARIAIEIEALGRVEVET